MAFNPQIIKEVQEKAAFKCCRCQNIGIEIHHIIPQKDSGLDTLENAAPLCPNCHAWFGDNTAKRKEITHMRDWWYRMVERNYPSENVNYALLSEINKKVEALTTNQEKSLISLKETLKDAAIDAIEKMTAGTAVTTASGIANATVYSPSPSPSFPPPEEDLESEDCPHCLSGLTKFGEQCPYCGNVCTVPH
jgi:hypothetical protein